MLKRSKITCNHYINDKLVFRSHINNPCETKRPISDKNLRSDTDNHN